MPSSDALFLLSIVSLSLVTLVVGMVYPGVPRLRVASNCNGRVPEVPASPRPDPIREVIAACGSMRGSEREYQVRLLKQIARKLDPGVKHGYPLPTGTQVDAWFQHDDHDYFVTIKRGLDNQQRLTIQGEIEDILTHAPVERRLKVLVVLGGERGWPPVFHKQFYSLKSHLAQRRDSASQARRHPVTIELVRASRTQACA